LRSSLLLIGVFFTGTQFGGRLFGATEDFTGNAVLKSNNIHSFYNYYRAGDITGVFPVYLGGEGEAYYIQLKTYAPLTKAGILSVSYKIGTPGTLREYKELGFIGDLHASINMGGRGLNLMISPDNNRVSVFFNFFTW